LDATVFSDALPSHELELALWLEADRMATLGMALTQETLDNQRDVVRNERRKKVDNPPYGTWEERLFAMAFPPANPYHHSSWGSMEELAAASLDEAREFFAAYYVPSNAVLAMVGDVDVEPALRLVERYFGPIAPGGEPPAPAGDARALNADASREEVIEDAPAPRVYVGCVIPPLGTAEFDVADLITDLLSTGRASRLKTRLVRELRLAQEVESYSFPLVGGASIVLIDVTGHPDVSPERLEAALDEELDRLAAEAPDDEEMERIRTRRATNRANLMQQAEERADRIGMYAALLNDPERFGTEAQRDTQIDGAAVAAVARESFGERHRVKLWFIPEDGASEY
jgi:predicted Zn-dependent peptidase